MSDKKQFPREAALVVANELYDELESCTMRLCIAGSLRRGKSTVGDIELLYVPMFEPSAARIDFFQDPPLLNVTEQALQKLLARTVLSYRPTRLNSIVWGEQNKLALHTESGIPVDLFATTLENWWVSLVIRTGSKETNLRLTMGANKLGRTLNAYGCGVTDNETGKVTPAHSEQKVFELCGVPYLPPEQR